MGAIVSLFLSSPAVAATVVYEMDWMTQRIPCQGTVTAGLNLAISDYYPKCQVTIAGQPNTVSICPANAIPRGGPFAQGQPITIIGSAITCSVDDPAGQCVAELGSASAIAPNAADILVSTAGTGSGSTAIMFPAGYGVPQGGSPSYDHFDIYAACSGKGSMQIKADIYYTAP